MKVFVTGGTGFVGNNIVRNLLKHGHDPVLLVRNKDSIKKIKSDININRLSFVYGSTSDISALKEGMSVAEAVIHLVGIIREVGSNTFEKAHYEGTKNVVDVAKSLGINRFIHMSVDGARPSAPSQYHRTKFRAEEYVRGSGLNYTIFKPAVLFGPDDKNFNVLADMIKKAPFIPVIGDGNYKWQPVSVKNVAELFVLALNNTKAERKIYEVHGTQVFTFNEILKLLMKILDIKRPLVHIPVPIVKPVVSLLGKFVSFLPITSDQIKLLFDNYDHQEGDLLKDFDMRLIPLEEGLREYIKRS